MNEVMIKRLKESKEKTITIFLHNDFRYTGRCGECDEKYLEIFDYKTSKIMIFEINQIKKLEVDNE